MYQQREGGHYTEAREQEKRGRGEGRKGHAGVEGRRERYGERKGNNGVWETRS